MKQKSLKILPYLALLIFAVIVWPWPEKEKDSPKETETAVTSKKTQSEQRINRDNKPAFQPKPLPESLKPKENKPKTFQVTNPEAIEFNEQDELVLTQGPGQNPKISEENLQKPQVKSAIEATQNPEKYKSRLSPLHASEKFDKDRFKNDPSYAKYLVENPEPARVWQTDEKSDIKLKRLSNYYLETFQNEAVSIVVKGAPLSPISILSTDLGRFKSSGLTHETQISNAEGIVEFQYLPPDGTFGTSNLLVGGYESASTLKFKIYTKIKPIKNN